MAVAPGPTTVEFQDTSRLQFGGVWISSDFYSHSGGYRLCLVLKSMKIDRPTNERRVTKPTQQIAVIAIDGGSDRKWPCEGTATMRFEIPRNKHLRGEPNPPFVVNFSIGEPSTNVQLRVKFEGILPPGFVRSWTSIPLECVPFYLEYSPPNTALSQQPAEILTNSTSNIIVKIEAVKVTQIGAQRALDLSLSEEQKKLELLRWSISPLCFLQKLPPEPPVLDYRLRRYELDLIAGIPREVSDEESQYSDYELNLIGDIPYEVSDEESQSFYPPDHILTKKELDVLASLLGGMKEIEFILDKRGGDVSIERIKRSLKEKGLMSILYHLEDDLRKGVKNMDVKHYEAYQQALKDGLCVNLSYLKFLFFGPPRSGKTSTRRRLLREIVNLIQLGVPLVSTGVAETSDVIIKKLTSEPAAIASSQWCPIMRATISTNNSEEHLRNLAHLFYQLIYKSTTLSSDASSSDPVSVQPHGHYISSAVSRRQRIRQKIQRKIRQKGVQVTYSESEEIKYVFEKLASILRFGGPEELERLLEELIIMINMMDVGGQPAFLDMLPALTTGPALYLLFFRLDQELKAYYPVRYLPADGGGEVTLESSYSTEEVLFRSLASIACFSYRSSSCEPQASNNVQAPENAESTQAPGSLESATMPQATGNAESASKPQVPGSAELASVPQAPGSAESASQPQSRAMLIGTYKDKVTDDKISQMESTLRERFVGTKLYKKGLLLKSGKGKIMFTVDNMFGTDESEMSDIRKDLEGIIKANFPPIPIPASWLMFRIVLNFLKKPVVSLAQCEVIARRLHMRTPVQEAIWFFHHNIGSLMHYPGILSMKDAVICEPQVIFDCISKLIIDKFKYENRALESYEVDEFSQKGQFSLSHIKDKTGQGNCPLTLDQLMDLLKHHNVVAEVTHDQRSEPKFIMPAVLKFASKEELDRPIACSSEHQAMMIHFDGGFVPFGVFSTCTAHLIAHQDSMTPKWQLCEEQVRRNKVTFHIDGAFYAVFIAQPQYLEIVVSRHPQAWSSRSLPEICSAVRQTVTESLRTVISSMKYKPFGTLLSSSTKQPFDLAFRCALDSHGDHLMKVVKDETGRYAKCLKDGINTRLEEKYHIWFGQNVGELQSKAPTSQKADSGSSAVPDSPVIPQVCHDQPPVYLSFRVKPALLQLIKWTEGSETKRFFLTDKIADKWRRLGRLLSIEGSQLEGFARQYQNDINECCQTVLTKWQENPPPKYPATWGGLVELLEDCRLPEVVKELKEILDKVDLS